MHSSVSSALVTALLVSFFAASASDSQKGALTLKLISRKGAHYLSPLSITTIYHHYLSLLSITTTRMEQIYLLNLSFPPTRLVKDKA